jgi:hypothetical protein
MTGLHGAGGIVMALMLTGCAAEPFAAQEPAAGAGMPGRWILSAPNAPSCGMTFEQAPGQSNEGTIQPEGGCPGDFFMSRHWALAQHRLTIANHDNEPLAQFKPSGGQFTGQSTAGTPVTLTR